MRKVIFKYPLEFTSKQDVLTHRHAKPLSVQLQNGVPTLWMEVDTSEPEIKMPVRTIATGEFFEVSEPWKHLTTLQMGSYVWHYYLPF